MKRKKINVPSQGDNITVSNKLFKYTEMQMKKEEHFPDINIENKVFRRLFCNLSALTLVLK